MNDDRTRGRNRKLKWLGLGLGLAMFGRRRLVRRMLMARMVGGTFGGPWGRYSGYRHGAPGGQQQAFGLPPFIEATLKAWHDRAHAIPPAGTAQV